MRLLFTSFLLFVGILLEAQGQIFGQPVIFEDGFEDGDFTSGPAWDGDTNDFTVVSGIPNYLLQLDAVSASPSYLSTSSTRVDGRWEFYIEYRGFKYSSSNQVAIFLMSDIADLKGTVNGYAVQIGQSGDDYFKLVRYDNGEIGSTVLTDSTIVGKESGYTVRISRDNSGNWQMQVAAGYGKAYYTAVTGTDNTYTSSAYFGPRVNFSSSRSDKFFFDFKIDRPPFTISNVTARASQIDVTFNRPYDQRTIQPSDFGINNNGGSPSSVSFLSPTVVRLKYNNALASDEYTLHAQKIQDSYGNDIATDASVSFTVFAVYMAGDVIINEFTYDPPDGQAEYVEIKNLSDKFLNLQNWQLGDDSRKDLISTHSLALHPHAFLVISGDTTALFNTYGTQTYIEPESMPSFNNNGDVVKILTDDSIRVDSLHYISEWGGNHVALERRSDIAPSIYKETFGNSPNSLGGTPGIANEVAADTSPPTLENLTTTDHRTLDLHFSERLDTANATKADNYSLANGTAISNAHQTAGDRVQLNLASPLQNGTQYQLTIKNQEDIFGNTAHSIDTFITYYEPAPADSGNVFINEFRYNPPPDSSEYIELYNPSSESFDLNRWTISDNRGMHKPVTKSPFIIPADSFVVIAADSSILNNNPHILLLSMGSNFPSLNDGGDAIVIRNSSGELLDSLNYASNWGGIEIALERRTIDAAPYQANFGDAPNGFGTPGTANEIPPDDAPPVITDFSIVSNQSLEFIYSEAVNKQSATDTRNYEISGGLNVRAATLVGQDTVRITLSGPLQNNTDYITTINRVDDLFGNSLTHSDTTFTYYEVTAADSGDIFINEFTYDPPEGSTEYIELYNPTAKSFDLRHWTINDNTGNRHTLTDQQYITPPGSFVVLAPDNTIQKNNPDISLLPMSSRFPSLNNNGDDIVLRNAGGECLDSLRYTGAWGGNGIALERRTTKVIPVQANFGDATGGFGTPGAANDIQPDIKPPTLNTLQILDNTRIRLILSEPITGTTATHEANYRIMPHRNIQLISAVQDTVTLFLSQKLQSGQNYTISIAGLQDLFGNTLAETNQHAVFVQYTRAKPGNIIINEILYSAENANDPEFVELYNPTDKNFDLTNWRIGDASSTATIDSHLRLRAGKYAVITNNASLANVLENAVYLSDFPSLNDDGDAVYIRNSQNISIDSLFYDAATFGGNVKGKSAERKDPQAASNDPANFATSTAVNGSTPGAKNSVYKLDTIPPEVIFSRFCPNGGIEVRFSEFISLNDDVKFTINDQPLTIDSFNPNEANSLLLHPSVNISAGTPLIVRAKNLSDIRGNTTSSTQVSVAQPVAKGNVVINEILYNPIDGSEDNQPDQSEYIELRNTRNYAVSLEGISLHDAPDEDGNTHALIPVSTISRYIPAQGTALIYADGTVNFKQSRISNFFSLADQPENTFIRIDRNTLSLPSSGDAIYFTTKDGNEIDSVFYDERWQNQNLVDTKGIALERINPEGPSNEASNWGSSTNEHGGTPNKENTLYQTPEQKPQQDIGIHFSPNPFSPDDDGTDDRLFINYKLDTADYLITARIYDRYGRLVRELADSKPAGITGSLIWDGLKDNGTRNRIGIYIVIFKAFDSADGNNKVFKKTVVLARRLN